MKEIALLQTGTTITADSRDIAENFDKQHKDVIRAVESLAEQTSAENCADLFIESSYQDSYGREQKCYLMTRDGFSLLVMRFTGAAALQWQLKYIEAFNKMEKALAQPFHIPATYQEALRLAADQADTISKQKQYIVAAQPAVLFAKSVQASETTILIRDEAKTLKQNGIDIGEKRLYQWLRDNGYLTRTNAPTQRAMDLGLFEVKERTINGSDGSVLITRTTMVTGKGQIYFVNKFLKEKSA